MAELADIVHWSSRFKSISNFKKTC